MVDILPEGPCLIRESGEAGDWGEQEVLVFPASGGQKRFWFLDQFEPGGVSYNLPLAFRLTGQLDISVLSRAVNEIVRRHEVLRTTFALLNGEPVQVILPRLELSIPLVDLSELTDAEREPKALSLTQEEVCRPFNLAKGPLVRLCLIRLDTTDHLALLTMHHIVSDQWSIGVFMNELSELYDAFSQGMPSPLPELSFQYADWVNWERSWLQGSGLEEQYSYWKERLGVLPHVLELPADRSRPAVRTKHGARLSTILPQPMLEELKVLSRREDCTLFMTLMAAIQVLLYRYSGQGDISVGTSIANRNRAETEPLIGLVMNTIIIRTDLSGNPTFRDVLKQVRQVSLSACAHSDIPFEELVEKLQPERNMSYSPLFQVVFILQNAVEESQLPKRIGGIVPAQLASGLTLSPVHVHSETAHFDLKFIASEIDGGMDISVEYSIDLFDEGTIARMLEHFLVLLEGAVTHPSETIDFLPLMGRAERGMLVEEWNQTRKDYNYQRCLQELIEDQVQRTPDAIAVVAPATAERPRVTLTYRELNQRANRLAHYLRDIGVGPESVVGVCVERTPDMIVGLLGVIKSGGAYLPIDPLWSAERKAFTISDSKAKVMLTQSGLIERLPFGSPSTADGLYSTLQIVLLDADWENIALYPDENPVLTAHPHNLVCMIYTPETNGQYQGVMLEHAGLVNQYLAWEQEYRLREVTTHLQMASFSLDVFSGDLVRALCTGGRLVLCPRDLHFKPKELYQLMCTEGVDAAEFLPTVLRSMIQYLDDGVACNLGAGRLDFLRLLICGFDRLFVEEYRQFLRFIGPQTRLIISFGLTETTINCSFFESDLQDLSSDQVVPVGRPLPNTCLYILDEHLQPQPMGIAGELYVGGPGVARGYHNRPELTNEKFLLVDFGFQKFRLYRTGNLARFLPNGNILLLGRMDNQVKIRGFRVEPGEIEFALRQHSGVKEAVVTVATQPYPQGVTGSDKRLVAYLVGNLGVERVEWESTAKARLAGGIGVPVTVRTMDLSCDGIRLSGVPESWRPATRIEITIQLPDAQEEQMFCGSIAWRSGGEAGVALETALIKKAALRQAIKGLMEVGGEQNGVRRARRVTLQSECEVKFRDGRFESYTIENFSASGVRMSVKNNAFVEGETILLNLRIPDEANELWAKGAVRWQRDGSAGIDLEVAPADRERLHRSLRSIYQSQSITLADLRLFLKSRMPDFMIPAVFVILDALPLTLDGRVDLDALPEPDWSRHELVETFVAPRTPVEELLAGLWSQVLGIESVGVHNNFFELGGNSLLAIQVISLIRDSFGIELPLRSLFVSPSVATLAEHIEVAQRKEVSW